MPRTAPGSVSPEGYGRFLTEVFDEWVRCDLGRLDVQLFAEMARVMAGGEAGLCWMRPVCGSVLIAEKGRDIEGIACPPVSENWLTDFMKPFDEAAVLFTLASQEAVLKIQKMADES